MAPGIGSEFIDCGPRVVHEDDSGPYVVYKGETVRTQRLADYVGVRIHVTASLLGDGWELSEWCDPVRRHIGGWWTRSGYSIGWVDA